MRIVIQRVNGASVTIDSEIVAKINQGIVILLGIEETDEHADIEWLCGKVARLRIFEDENGIMNCSVKDTDGDVIVVSQFTLYASTKKGNRPSYIRAARPEKATSLYEAFVNQLEKELEKEVYTGRFGAHMEIMLRNDGPVTIIIDSKNRE